VSFHDGGEGLPVPSCLINRAPFLPHCLKEELYG
jgi:hypothetical protein